MIKQIITINREGKVDARELHEFLEVKTRFNDWIQRKIQQYGFIEGKDFYSNLSKTLPQGGRPTMEYELSISMAKELCMLENTDKGKQARLYFIKCEEEWKGYREIEMMIAQAQRLLEHEREIMEIRELERKQDEQIAEQSKQIDAIIQRLSNLDGININGTPRQILNSMIRYYAFSKPCDFAAAWKKFYKAFNTAFNTNIKLRYKSYLKNNNEDKKNFPLLAYMEENNLINDAIRVADKLLQELPPKKSSNK